MSQPGRNNEDMKLSNNDSGKGKDAGKKCLDVEPVRDQAKNISKPTARLK